MVVWAPSYAATWGWRNFFALCDVAVVLTCVGLWRNNLRLVSSQALVALSAGALWSADVGSRLATGKHLFGGTEYMWNPEVPFPIRLLSLFHLGLPVMLVLLLRRTGYDRRALGLQAGITAGLLVVSRAIGASKNLNYAFRDPLWHRQLGPAPLHLAAIFAGTVVLVYGPIHLALCRLLPPPRA